MELRYHSERAANARFGRLLGQTGYIILIGCAIALLLGGVALVVVMKLAIGWFIASLCVIPAMFAAWYKAELTDIPPHTKQSSVDAWLESAMLGQLPEHASPRVIAGIAGESRAGHFMAVRLGVTGNLLQNITSDNPTDSDELWTRARAIQKQVGAQVVHGGIVAAAIIEQSAQKDMLLAQLNLEWEDIINALQWYDHLHDLVQKHSVPKRTGGIARDWSFGYVPLLSRFGMNLSEQAGGFTVELEAHAAALGQLLETFGSNGRQNAVLVGPTGVGKTTILHAFAEKLLDANAELPSSLKFRQVFLLDSSALISAAPGRGELEGLIMRVLTEAYSAKNIIICLDNAQLFFEEGIGSVDITNVLLPILEAGNLRVILTMDEQRLLQIGQRNPALINALNRISIQPATKAETLAVMQDQLIMTEYKRGVTYTYQALVEAYRLSERYVHDLAMPGRALKLMESAAGYAQLKLVTMNSVQQAIEQTMNVKVSVASAEGEREMLLNLEDKIHERMINQKRAVQVVCDALRRARTGVRNQERPIGTFLFLGPTGVGKTELAKALAGVYFGGEEKIIRLDLNEYVSETDVGRLIADGADDPHSLTAQVMKQPFSVILLDEIEKAHPSVLTTLLQLLDEGVLRDIKNREVSFKDAIIIATSNAGAMRIREYIDRGYQLSQFESTLVDELVSSNQFKAEFLNRFDEIVVFTPLSKEDLAQVVDIMIAQVNTTLALQKISVVVDDDAKALLVERGYDPRLGARPMRRVVQRAVENTVAKEMLRGSVSAGSTVHITLAQVTEILGDAAIQPSMLPQPDIAPQNPSAPLS